MIAPALVAATLLFGPRANESERREKLKGLFTPPPGSSLSLDRLSYLENRADAGKIKGEVWVKPPKGRCLILRGDLKKPDKRICKATPYKWTIDDLDALGHLNILVLIDEEWDDGLVLRWNTNYRVGNFTAAGDKDEGTYDDIVIKSCTATNIDGDRSILLQSFEGRRWRINLPQYDKPVNAEETAIPNLLVNIDSKKNADGSEKGHEAPKKDEHGEAKKDEHGEAKKEDEHGEKKPEKKNESGGGSVLGQLLTKGYKEAETQEVTFNLPKRGAYTMESGRFTETGSPQGMKGECRYMFKNAPGDPKSGAIECHDTDTMDKVYVHVTCFSELKPRLDPNPPKPPKPKEEEKPKGAKDEKEHH